MKKSMLVVAALTMFASFSYSQDAALPAISGTAVETPVSSPIVVPAGIQQAVQVAQVVSVAKLPSGPFSVKSRLSLLPSIALAQSFTSADQAIGVHKDLASLYKGPYELVRVGVFGGFYKPVLSAPSQGPRSLAGMTVLIPGSAFDWAMGTDYGAKWLPALKSGILVAYDATRPKEIHLRPDFAGPILSYQFGSVGN